MSDLLRLYAPEECGSDGYPFAWDTCPTCEGLGWFDCFNVAHPAGTCKRPVTTADGDSDGFDATCCDSLDGCPSCFGSGSIKQLIRQQAGHRCIRCGHPYKVGESGEWEANLEGRGFGPAGPPWEINGQPVQRALFEEYVTEHHDIPHFEGRARHWSDCDENCTHGGPVRWRDTLGPEQRWEVDPMSDGSVERILTLEPTYEIQAAWRILTVHHLTGEKADCRWWNLTSLCQRDHLNIQRRVNMNAPWPWDHTGWFKPHAAAWYAWKYLGEDLTREQTEERLGELLRLGLREEGVERMAL